MQQPPALLNTTHFHIC